MRLVLGRGLAITGGGIVVGAAAAVALTNWLGDLLYAVSPRDPIVFGAVLAIMLVVSLVACVVPSWRAARVDPLAALRQD